MTDSIARLSAFVAGACAGSFLNVCVARWPAGMSVIRPASHCPHCGRGVRARENVPVLGWLWLRGRCAGCAERISPQYPLVELGVALVWLGAAWAYGAGFTALRVAVFITILLGVALTDARHYEIPDDFTVFGLIWMLVTAVAGLFTGGTGPFAGPWDALIGACAGAGAIAIAGWLGEAALGREAMGFGDVTLMAVVGAALGAERALLTIFLGAVIGVVVFVGIVVPLVRMRPRPAQAASGVAGEAVGSAGAGGIPQVPFGVFLAPAAVIALLAGDAMIRWYTARLVVP